MPTKNPYKILGISKWQSPEYTKKAYRKLAVKYHPDKNPDNSKAEAKFKEVSEAYDILTNPEKKRLYDKYGDINIEEVVDTSAEDELRDINKNFKDISFGIKNILKKSEENKEKEEEEDKKFKVTHIPFKSRAEVAAQLEERGHKLEEGYFYGECRACNTSGMITEQKGFLSVTKVCKKCNGVGYLKEIDYSFTDSDGKGASIFDLFASRKIA